MIENETLTDQERFEWLVNNLKEEPLNPRAYSSEICPDLRLKYKLPTLVSYDSIGQTISLREAIDNEIKKGKK